MNIAGKILACVLVLGIHIGISVFGIFSLMVGMNGFTSGEIPSYGFMLYIIWGVISALILTLLSYFSVVFFADKKNVNQYLAAFLTILLMSVLSGIIMIVGWFASLMLVSVIWENRRG